MSLLNILSLILLIIFFSAIFLKLVMLYNKNKISANVLAKGNKDRKIKTVEATVKISTFIWGVTWVVEIFAGVYINGKLYVIYSSEVFNYIGMLIITIGVSIFITAMISMKTSWRVGIDKSTKTSLVTYGIYNFSRNPAFVGLDTMFVGFFLTYPNVLTMIIVIVNIISIHRLILQEEKHLEKMFGKEYKEYQQNTPRYVVLR